MLKSVPPMLLQALNIGALLAFILTAAFNGLAADTSIGIIFKRFNSVNRHFGNLSAILKTLLFVPAFVHNGLGIYAAWTTIASFLNMGFVIAYRANPAINQSTASSISLGFITAALFLFVITDLFVFDRYSRYTITPYGVIVWALSGSLAKNFDAARGNSIFTIVLIVIGVLALIAKIVFVIIRSKSKPVFTSSTNITMPEKQDTVGMA
ncbi:uncharacterized protein [Haliotis cracherodii]|uniref:uncharacterized protein n=1 Tax=Haliotis cracherodii TaxID=6455 RepID=UPI0039EC2DC8